jgi:hypothetical protein
LVEQHLGQKYQQIPIAIKLCVQDCDKDQEVRPHFTKIAGTELASGKATLTF